MSHTSEYAATWPLGRTGRSFVASLIGSIERDVVATVGVRLLIVAGGFVSSVLTARWLSPAGRGEYFVVVTLAQMLAQFGTFGLQSSNTYFVARDRSLLRPLLANSLWVALIAGGLGSVIVILALSIYRGRAVDARLWFAVLLAPATLFYLLGTNLLVGLRRITAFNAFQLASNYGVLVCLVAAAALGAGPTGFLAASAVGWAIVSWRLLVTVRDQAKGSLALDRFVFHEGFRYAAKAYIATLCGFLIVRVNIFLLAALNGPEQVGYYSVASQIGDVIGIVPQSMALVLFPTLITTSEARFPKTLRNLAVVALLLAAGCGLVAFLAEPFIGAVFGPKFLQTVPVLRLMLPGVFFLGLTAILSQYLAACGFPLSLVVVWVAGSVMAAGLGKLLIPVGSGAGAALALSLSHAGVFAAVLGLSINHARRAARTSPFVHQESAS